MVVVVVIIIFRRYRLLGAPLWGRKIWDAELGYEWTDEAAIMPLSER
jgi:hypothetical protein